MGRIVLKSSFPLLHFSFGFYTAGKEIELWMCFDGEGKKGSAILLCTSTAAASSSSEKMTRFGIEYPSRH